MTKIALVTGATAGFGNAICRTLLKAGYLVIGTGRRQERLTQLEQEYGSQFFPLHSIFLIVKRLKMHSKRCRQNYKPSIY